LFIFIVANKTVLFYSLLFLIADATTQLRYCANKTSLFARLPGLKTNIDRMSAATTINGINLLAGLPTTEAIRCAVEAEWLCNNYDKYDNTDIYG
jgi:hypothetical protein